MFATRSFFSGGGMSGFVIFCLLSVGGNLNAQIDTGTILGTVKDQSGAVVPDATVTLTHVETAFTLSASTRMDGTYIFTPIRIGTYSVEAEFTGFRKARHSGVTLRQQQQIVVDLTLEPGAITETVEVLGEAPLLQTESASVGEVMGSKAAVNLPLQGRNYNFLAQLTAGVTHGQQEGRGLNDSGWFSANGTRPAQSNLMLDGIDNNSNNVDFLAGAAYIIRPPVDAIQEFSIQTNSFKAEFGRAGGAILNATVKSGTNKIHGTLWEFIRNDKLDAADFFQNKFGSEKGKLRRNEFGFAIGGPIIKNKTFWFADYSGLRTRRAANWVRSIPTAAERASGFTDFRDLITTQTGSRTDLLGRTFPTGTVFDPATTRGVNAGVMDPVTGITTSEGGFVRDPFFSGGSLMGVTDFTADPNLLNVIPPGRLSQSAVDILNLLPAPNAPGIFNNFTANPVGTDDGDQFDIRVDHVFSEVDQIFVRYNFFDGTRFKPAPFEGIADGGSFNDGDETLRNQSAALSWTHTFSPTLINEFRVGFTREVTVRLQPLGNDTSDIPAQFGIPGVLQVEGNGGLPMITGGGLDQIGARDWLVSDRFSNTYQFTENLTKVYGSHTFKGGFQYQHITFPWSAPPWSRGRFDFSGNYTSIPNLGDSSTGRVQLLLAPTTSSVGGIDNVGGADTMFASNFGGIDNGKEYYGAYIQDDWKVTPKLTLNLGLRWEFFALVKENFGAQANFIPGAPGSTARFIIPADRQGNPPLSPSFINGLAADGIELAFSDEFGLGVGNSANTNFGPRFGFAYRVNEKLVLRGGYGVYYGGFENRGGFPNLGYNYPFQFTFGFFPPNSSNPIDPNNAIGTLESGFTNIAIDPVVVNAAGLNLRGIELDYITPYTQGYNFTIQYELSPNDSLEVGYVGSLGRHIETFSGTNHVTQLAPPDVDPQTLVPFPTFQRNSTYASTNANSYYHSLQTKFTHRFSHGVQLLAAYTWSKVRTYAHDLLNGGGDAGFRAPDIPGVGIKADIGLANFDVPHALNLSGTYELPIGSGKSFLANVGGVADAVLGGWSVNWIVTMYSGNPTTIGCTNTTAAGLGCYALLTGQDVNGGPHDVDQYWNPAAFTNPPAATTIGQTDFAPLGGAASNARGPGFHRADFSIFKQFSTTENTRVEFRGEFFNLTNTPNFALPSGRNFTTANFGQITSTRAGSVSARTIQFGLKFYF